MQAGGGGGGETYDCDWVSGLKDRSGKLGGGDCGAWLRFSVARTVKPGRAGGIGEGKQIEGRVTLRAEGTVAPILLTGFAR